MFFLKNIDEGWHPSFFICPFIRFFLFYTASKPRNTLYCSSAGSARKELPDNNQQLPCPSNFPTFIPLLPWQGDTKIMILNDLFFFIILTHRYSSSISANKDFFSMSARFFEVATLLWKCKINLLTLKYAWNSASMTEYQLQDK